ncbi:MAG: hypothetical protein PHD70_12410 [Anaerostipes sp.]|nr:hypothetical protein [Anaerostipes sp.]MDD3747260.1 hypothetical protein [Anaerostipes sp.]
MLFEEIIKQIKEAFAQWGGQSHGKKPQKKSVAFMVLIALVFVAAYYYVTLPSINYQETGFWSLIITVLAILTVILALKHLGGPKKSKTFQASATALVVVIVVFLLGMLLSSQIFSSGKYSSLLKVEDKTFEKDMKETEKITDIALMDTEGAQIIGERAIGSLSDVVSQYEVSESYSQIDYNGKPMKVAPLYYASFIRYINNQKNGIPGYVQVDPITNEAKYVKLKQPMQYSPSAYFNKNLKRHLRFQYPTAIFQGYYFEIDNKGNPYFICPVLKSNAGLFGAKDVKGAVICDPVTGKSKYYAVKDIPRWVDHVYDGRLLLQKYNWKGLLSGGYINSILGKKGCKVATDNYGYRVIDGDVWAYTGVTSVNGDSSNIAFVLMNMRTAKSKYYTVSGANEQSAMEAAEGQVQHLGYSSAFPALINVAGKPTYVMILKDKGGLVKMYAMVNVEKYNIVATSSTQQGVLKEYKRLLVEQGIVTSKEIDTSIDQKIKIKIAQIQFVPIDGNTYVYVTDTKGYVYKQEFSKNETSIKWKVGDTIWISYEEGNQEIRQIAD